MDRKGVVIPHERTFKGPKKDRYNLIRQSKANLSPIFLLAPGKMKALELTYNYCRKKKPLMDFNDFTGIRNRLWCIDNDVFARKIADSFKGRRLFIADGHHRFEVGYKYFKDMNGSFRDLDYILSYITDSYSGLVVLPTHRVVKSSADTKTIIDKISCYFDFIKVDKASLEKKLKRDNKAPFALCTKGKFYLLHLKNSRAFNNKFKKAKDKIFKDLNVYILHKLILSRYTKDDLDYTHSFSQAVKLAGKSKCAFILKATPLDTVLRISSKGYRLPQKSTYFYPKLLSGLLIRRF
jgi:uncharacterized protein (DUF1015 family)